MIGFNIAAAENELLPLLGFVGLWHLWKHTRARIAQNGSSRALILTSTRARSVGKASGISKRELPETDTAGVTQRRKLTAVGARSGATWQTSSGQHG